ncbi:expressed unknown protein [Seminavis robusta]|uniref:Uncharacterized protein n=1 Tax=Seminavis robusta TaxID=568900 RepID=A0A9N8EZT4_9STRA|nr:expressed unknown protein [Seminavis robusta]|eukprot:Sro2475_g328740.1 n/a (228) ;mRNA; f:13512-14195
MCQYSTTSHDTTIGFDGDTSSISDESLTTTFETSFNSVEQDECPSSLESTTVTERSTRRKLQAGGSNSIKFELRIHSTNPMTWVDSTETESTFLTTFNSEIEAFGVSALQVEDHPAPTNAPTASPTTTIPTTSTPTVAIDQPSMTPTTLISTTDSPSTLSPSTDGPTTDSPSTASPSTAGPTTLSPSTAVPSTGMPQPCRQAQRAPAPAVQPRLVPAPQTNHLVAPR